MEIELNLKDFLKDYRWTSEFQRVFKECQDTFLLHSDRWSLVYDYVDEYCPNYKSIVTEITNYIEDIIKED